MVWVCLVQPMREGTLRPQYFSSAASASKFTTHSFQDLWDSLEGEGTANTVTGWESIKDICQSDVLGITYILYTHTGHLVVTETTSIFVSNQSCEKLILHQKSHFKGRT